jgi:hypothetical protein
VGGEGRAIASEGRKDTSSRQGQPVINQKLGFRAALWNVIDEENIRELRK